MIDIYITRHGQTVWNKEGKIQGNKNSALTEDGILGAELMCEKMRDIEIDYIISSPIERAMKTAQIIKGEKEVPIIECDGLKEINCGDFEGVKFEDISIKFPEEFKKVRDNPFKNRYPNGENLIDFYERVINSFNNIVEQYEGKRILIVGHGGTIKCIETFINNKKIGKGWFESIVENCSFTHLIVNNNQININVFNDTTHLNENLNL